MICAAHASPLIVYYSCTLQKKGLHPSPSSNEFLHADSIRGPGVLYGLSLKKTAITAHYLTVQWDWGDSEAGCSMEGAWSVCIRRSPPLRATSLAFLSPAGQNIGSMSFITGWQRLMCFCGKADRNPVVSYACTLMSCAAACWRGHQHLFCTLIPGR